VPHSQRQNGDVNWPPRSRDLTPLDYFLWRAVKDKCYANHPETIDDLKHEIEVAIRAIEGHTIENVFKNWIDRMGYCKASRGSHMNEKVVKNIRSLFFIAILKRKSFVGHPLHFS